MIKPTYEVQGHVFTLKPTTPTNRRACSEFFVRIGETMEGVDGSIVTLEDLAGQYDELRSHFDLFCLITEGPHDKLDFQEFDYHVAKQAETDYFEPATLMMLQQIGFLNL